VIESHWGESSHLSLGVEEELMILDAETLEQVPRVDVLAEPPRLKTELHAAVVEINTEICATPEEALEQVRRLRAQAGEKAAAHGLRLAAGGAHPRTVPEELDVVQESRYLEFVRYAGPSARRQGVCGLHVHVGMPSGDDCIHVLETVLPWLPVALALSANSPFLAGRETGFLSSRAPILAELPRSGAPPLFESYAGWEEHVERLMRLNLPADYTALWWDARPHPRFGTLELRMPDQPTAVERTGAFVALLRGLCAWALEQPRFAPAAAARGIYQQNRWAAARFGPRAELISPDGERLVPASELGRELFELAGTDGGLDPDSCEADRLLEVGLEGAAADLAARSVASPPVIGQ
jgi:carboxylate-amine ligase